MKTYSVPEKTLKTLSGFAGLAALPSVRSAEKVMKLGNNLDAALESIGKDAQLTSASKILKAQKAGKKTAAAISAALDADRVTIDKELTTLAKTLKSNQLRSQKLTPEQIVMLPAVMAKYQEDGNLDRASDSYLTSIMELVNQGLVKDPTDKINAVHSGDVLKQMDDLLEADGFIEHTKNAVNSFVEINLRSKDAALIENGTYTDLEIEGN